MRPWKWAILTTLAVVAFVFLLSIISPTTRYMLIPAIGGAPAPALQFEGSTEILLVDTPGELFGNTTHTVESLQEVPHTGGWINTGPLDIDALLSEGRYVLLEFWSSTCIECIRSSAYTQEFWERYREYGLVVIGVHVPTFTFEQEPAVVLSALERYDITYPVLLDAELLMDFSNSHWPGKYLISPEGEIIWVHFGEGNYETQETAIRAALGATLPEDEPLPKHLELSGGRQTPTLYAGNAFTERPFGNDQQPVLGEVTTHTIPQGWPVEDHIFLHGDWYMGEEYVESRSPGKILVNYRATTPYIVLSSDETAVDVLLNERWLDKKEYGVDIMTNEAKSEMTVTEPRIYTPISESRKYRRDILELRVQEGVRLYAIAFGAY